MKIRNGFVSNSSSSSFVLDENNIEAIKKKAEELRKSRRKKLKRIFKINNEN